MHGAILLLLLMGAAQTAAGSDAAGGQDPLRLAVQAAALDVDTTLYREARRALNEGELARAASLFDRLRREHPNSVHAVDAYYWEAFARQRLGGEANLRRALALLEEQAARHAEARTRADARALEVRIRGALAQAGDPEAGARLARDARQEAAGCEDADLRAAALAALARSEPDAAADLAVEVLRRRDECSTPLREHAVHLLSRRGTPETASVLRDVVRTDPSRRVQEAALWALARTAGSVGALAELYGGLEEARHREAVLYAIQRSSDAEARAFLLARAMDPQEEVRLREAALYALARTAGTAEMIEIYGRLGERRLREAALYGIARSNDAAAHAFLRERALDAAEQPALREAALYQVVRAAEPAEVVRLYRGLDEPRLKEAALYGLVRNPADETVELLIEIARTETERRFREAAIHALGRSNDPRARQFLRELVTRP